MRIVPILFPSDLGRSDRGAPFASGFRGAPDVLLDLLEDQGIRFGRPVVVEVPRPEGPDAEDAPLKFDALHVVAATRLAEAVAATNAEGNFPLILGGDHTTLFGHLLGHAKRHPEGFGLAVLADARDDLLFPAPPVFSNKKRLREDPEVTRDGDAHAMALAGVLRHFPKGTALATALEGCTLTPDHTSVVGVRTPPTAQVKRLRRKSKLEVWDMERLEFDGEQTYRSMLERHLARGPIALSIDVRGIDPELMGAVHGPVPDGLDRAFLKRSLEQCLPHRDRILGLDICELDPSADAPGSIGQVRFAETLGPFLRKLVR